jgi:hypothetical protein
MLVDAARREAPVGKSGTLRRAIHRSPVRQTTRGRWTVTVGEDDSTLTASGAHYGAFVQKGTRAHLIRPRYRKALRFAGAQTRDRKGRFGARGVVFARGVHHPGTHPNPYMQRAIQQVRPIIAARSREMVARALRKARAG